MTDDREYVETARLDAFGYTVPDGSDEYKKGFQDGVDFVLDRFYNLPREDVAPVIHAHWERVTGGVHFPFRCSRCGEKADSNEYTHCHCGAKMDEEAKEEV